MPLAFQSELTIQKGEVFFRDVVECRHAATLGTIQLGNVQPHLSKIGHGELGNELAPAASAREGHIDRLHLAPTDEVRDQVDLLDDRSRTLQELQPGALLGDARKVFDPGLDPDGIDSGNLLGVHMHFGDRRTDQRLKIDGLLDRPGQPNLEDITFLFLDDVEHEIPQQTRKHPEYSRLDHCVRKNFRDNERMEQQQFQVRFSLGTKLLLSVVTLLLIVIGFLTASTIVVLTEDKRAYTFQSQGTETLLAGKEFININTRAISALRLALSSFDPSKPLSTSEQRRIQEILDNQADMVTLQVGRLREFRSFLIGATLSQEATLRDLGIQPDSLTLAPEWFPIAEKGLKSSSVYLVNTSKAGLASQAILLADTKYPSKDGTIPLVVGFLPIRDFAKEFRGSRITIANRDGYVLFDSDNSVQFSAANVVNDPIFQRALQNPVASGAGEFRLPNERILSSYTRPGLDLVVISRIAWEKAMASTYTLAEKFILLGLVCIAAAVIFALVFAKSLTAPILQLYQATREVASGNFDLHLPAKGRDEIGALGASFNVMSRKISDLIDESMKKVQLENELAIASTVQQTLIPPSHYQDSRIEIASRYQAASQCGGDWWGFFKVENRLCLMIADATGHGISSALITASARSCFSVMHKLAQEDPDFTYSPGAMLAYANRVVHEAASGQIMMTFFSCVLDFDTQTLTYASAGHNPPWLFQRKGEGFKLNSLTPEGPRVGESPDIEPYPEKTLPFSAGDMLVLYTDGLPEGKNTADEQFGKKRLRKLVEGSVAAGPQAVIDAIMGEFMPFNEGKDLDDDVTLAVARIL